MSDPTAPVEGTPTSAAPEAAPSATPAADPYAPVYSRVDELAGSVGDLRALVEQRLPAPEPEPEPDPWAQFRVDPEPETDIYGNPVQPQPAFDVDAVQTAFQQALQQANAPLQQQLQAMQAERAREQLLANVPALKDPQVAQQTIDSMVSDLTAAQAPPEVIQWALSSPVQIQRFFEAAEAKKLAAGQAPASEQVPNVESAGGAVPGGNGEQPNIVHQVMRSRAQGLPSGFN